MWRRIWFIIVVLFSGGLFVFESAADYLEVRRGTTLKAQPESHAMVVERVAVGDFLPLLNDGAQVDGYYNVRPKAPGQTAWIYRSMVRRWYGEMPMPVEDESKLSPLRDPTLNLTPEQVRFARRHLRLGKPQAVYERVRAGYVTAQDGRLKIPLWVQYEINPEELNGPVARSDDFQPDTSVPVGYRAELKDYNGNGFDRGHMAPAEDMNRSQRTMAESFLLSNMAPQVGRGFNQQLWKNLESAVRGWVAQRGTLTIITGPVFAIRAGKVSYAVIGDDHVAVPSHYFKIIVDANSTGHIDTLAFVIPNENLSGHQYKEYLTSIDQIEALTGLDFLSALDPDIQNQIESKKADSAW